MHYLDVETQLHDHESGLVIARQQHLTQEFMDALTDERHASKTMRAGEFHKVASIPAAVFDNWFARGMDPYRMSAREIVAQLKRDHLDAFLATERVV